MREASRPSYPGNVFAFMYMSIPKIRNPCPNGDGKMVQKSCQT